MASKHFKKDPFFPAFTVPLFGITDMDLLELYFGILEGGLARDVTNEYLVCYNSESVSKIISAAWTNISFT